MYMNMFAFLRKLIIDWFIVYMLEAYLELSLFNALMQKPWVYMGGRGWVVVWKVGEEEKG